MQYAVIESGSKQYIVQKGTTLSVEKLLTPEGDTVVFDKVPLFVDDKKMQLGKPYCDIVVEAKVVSQGRGPKLQGMHYESSSYRRKFGHKQPLTTVEIISISAPKKGKKE